MNIQRALVVLIDGCSGLPRSSGHSRLFHRNGYCVEETLHCSGRRRWNPL